MALVYDFIFVAADYSGCEATIVDAAGEEIADSPITLDAAGRFSLSLDEGVYSASTSNTNLGFGNAHTTGVLNIPASIAAGGGGGAIPDGPQLFVECNAGQELVDSGSAQNILFDAFGDLDPTHDGNFTLPAGVYTVDHQVNFDEPDAEWTFQFGLGGTRIVYADGPRPIRAGTDPSSHRASSQGTIVLLEDSEVGGTARISCDPDAVDPTPLNISYAVLTFTPVFG